MLLRVWPSTRRKLRLIQTAIGPAPWYWETFPEIVSLSGRHHTWTHHGNLGDLAYVVSLSETESPLQPKIALGIYSRPFPLPGGRLGVWFPKNNNIHIACFDVEALPRFVLGELSGFAEGRAALFAKAEPLAETVLRSDLPEGKHTVNFDPQLSRDELLVVSERSWACQDEATCAILAVVPAHNSVTVYPQKWLTAAKVDIGYQWVTRVVRDAATGRFLGDGFRIGCFELTADGCHRQHWL